MSIVVDHAVVNVLADMDAAAAHFAALGFVVEERGYHSLGSINNVILFEHDYLELVGIEPGATKIRQEIAEGPAGLNGLVFRSDDARAQHERLRLAGIPVLAPVDFERPVELDGRAVSARFTTVRLAADFIPSGRVYYCQHHTPELVWRMPLPRHGNGATGLAGLVVVTAEPAATAARWARTIGAAPDPVDGGVRFDLRGIALEICAIETYRARYGDFGCSAAQATSLRRDFMGALALRTRSLESARACLSAAAVADARVRWHDHGSRLTVATGSTWDCPIDFVPAAT